MKWIPPFLDDWTSSVLVMCYAMVIIVNLPNEYVPKYCESMPK